MEWCTLFEEKSLKINQHLRKRTYMYNNSSCPSWGKTVSSNTHTSKYIAQQQQQLNYMYMNYKKYIILITILQFLT